MWHIHYVSNAHDHGGYRRVCSCSCSAKSRQLLHAVALPASRPSAFRLCESVRLPPPPPRSKQLRRLIASVPLPARLPDRPNQARPARPGRIRPARNARLSSWIKHGCAYSPAGRANIFVCLWANGTTSKANGIRGGCEPSDVWLRSSLCVVAGR